MKLQAKKQADASQPDSDEPFDLKVSGTKRQAKKPAAAVQSDSEESFNLKVAGTPSVKSERGHGPYGPFDPKLNPYARDQDRADTDQDSDADYDEYVSLFLC